MGTIYNNKPNYTTIGDIAIAGLNPPLIMISINANHACLEHINKHKLFSINIPTIDLLKEVDYAGIHSGKTIDKSTLLDYDLIDDLPIIKDAPISMIVKENQRIQIDHRTVLVCNVKKTLVDRNIINSKELNLQDIKTILYGLDNKYYTLGETIGTGYKEGHKVYKSIE